MRQILLIIFSFFVGQSSFAQTDSVFLSNDSKLISEIQIIIPHGDNGTREHYTHFKHQYWLGVVDTVSMSIVDGTKHGAKKAIIEYDKYGICDSIINQIRNNSQYWKMLRVVDDIAEQEIGFRNKEFINFKYLKENQLNNFALKCQEDFKIENTGLQEQLLKEIQRIKESKIDRYNELKINYRSIDSEMISAFIETYDVCVPDLKSFEIIVLNNPESFVNAIDKLSDLDFFAFSLKLDRFPENSKISEMKESLKKVATKGKRKRKIIRKIKTTKG